MKSIHKAVLTASASLLAVLVAAPAMAQETSTSVEEVVVTGIRASLQQSIQSKRNADAIVDVVTAEDVGKFPSSNVAEALTIVPGVTVDRQFGQGEKVSILGTDPALNRTLLNGQTVASADWFILDQPGRTFNYALLAPQIVGKVEVYKSPEARIDEGSIGGTVIVNTRKPLDLKALTLQGSLSYLYNDRSKESDPQVAFLGSWKNEAGTFGIAVSAQHAKDQLRRDGIESYGTIPASYYNGGNPENPVSSITNGNCTGTCAATLAANPNARGVNSLSVSYFEQERVRDSYTAAVQWRPTDALELNFDWLKIKATYDNTNQSLFAFQGNTWNSLGALTDIVITDNVIRKASFKNALSVLDVQYREAELNSDTYHFNGKWTGDGFDVAGDLGYSKADGGTKRQLYGEFLNWADYTVDFTGTPGAPGVLTYTNPAANGNPLADASKFSFDGGWGAGDPSVPGAPGYNSGWGGNIVSKPTTDKETYGQLDFGKDFEGVIKRVQFGYKYRKHETTQAMSGVTVAVYGNPASASQFSPSIVPSNYLRGFDGVTDQMGSRFKIDGKALADYIDRGGYLRPWQAKPVPTVFGNAEFTAQNWGIEETINALYGQANFQADNVRGNFGLRYVKTESDSGGYACVNQTATGCGTTAADWAWKVKSKKYEDFLPSLNVIVDVQEDLVFRFAAAQVISRPNYADMSNYFWLSDQILTGGGGNPDLNPYKSSNVNASLEWYFAPEAILSAEAFHKDISNYILQQTVAEPHFNQARNAITTYQISRPTNAGSATVKGLAVAYQQTFGMGFGLLANYTYADGEADGGSPLPYNSKHQINVSPFYEHGPFSARVTYNWRSKYFTGLDRGDQMFVRAFKGLDATAGYAFSENVNLSVSAQNLLDSEYYAYANTTMLPRGVYRTGRKLQATLNVAF
ncbi:TonB-dependent receptor [Caulobacter sp. CCNWLY153]|uniref:TonB-dependent receptor n=1 Tax=unclassified Caulobacter TaxID=2648921 RepID=UPI002FEFDA44